MSQSPNQLKRSVNRITDLKAMQREAKAFKKENWPEFTHTESLNFVARKYGYETWDAARRFHEAGEAKP